MNAMAACTGSEAPAWTAIARLDAKPPPPLSLLSSAGSRAGVSTLVLDTGILLNSNVVYSLPGTADQFVTITEALEEIRDPVARAQLAALPFKLLTAEPSQDALSKVVQFARATGDVHALSNVDLKLLALTYMLEVEAHGSSHLRAQPPPLQLLPKHNLKHKDPPGWGNNVSNPEEWEEIGRLEEQAGRADGDRKSRILTLQTLSLEVSDQPAAADANVLVDDLSGRLSDAEMVRDRNDDVKHLSPKGVPEDSSSKPLSSRGGRNRKKVSHHMEPVKVEGKLMVSVGVDATKGQHQEEPGEWEKACSRSTRRKHQRRSAKTPSLSSVLQAGKDANKQSDNTCIDGSVTSELPEYLQRLEDRAGETSVTHVKAPEDDLPELLDLEDDEDDDESWCRVSESEHADRDYDKSASENRDICFEEDLDEEDEGTAMNMEGLMSAVVNGNEIDSEESPTGVPSFRSSIACMTPDYAMQNVLLQIGLRLVSAGGLLVQELHRWVLKCQACNHVTADAGRLFCPKCGNGGTLYRMSVTVGGNGILHAGRQRRVNLRGTRYSLPLPKGGREGALQNPILREDQLPKKLLHPTTKKVSFSEGLDSCDAADVFNSKASARRGANLGNAAAIFSGRKNPNERRVSRRH